MKTKKTIMVLVHHLLRPIWGTWWKTLYFIVIGLSLLLSKKLRVIYKRNKNSWQCINTLHKLESWFKLRFVYTYDGWKGIFDHDNSWLEWYTLFGDCDDMGRMVQKKLSSLGFEAFRVGILGDKINSWHYDCAFKHNNAWYLFNYGNKVFGTDTEGCVEKLEFLFRAENGESLFPVGKTIYWKCLY